MSLPVEAAKIAAERLLSGRPQNIIAQTDARHILQEVREHEDNYPRFDPRLTEKATHIAYALIACGCSIVENGDNITNTTEGLSYLEKAGKILYDTYKYNPHEEDNKNYSLLIAGMALFAAKQYSRAFITLNDIDFDFSVGQIITSFIKKDFAALMKETNETDIKLIIIDEGHLLGANERLLRIEMFLTHIKEYAARQNIRVVLLSAVLPNAEDLPSRSSMPINSTTALPNLSFSPG